MQAHECDYHVAPMVCRFGLIAVAMCALVVAAPLSLRAAPIDDKDEILQSDIKDSYRAPAVVEGEKTCTVTVTADKPALVAGLPLRIWRKVPPPQGWAMVNSDEPIAGGGAAKVQLSRGSYQFELLGVVDRKHVVAVHSAVVNVTGDAIAAIALGEPRRVSVTLGPAPVEIEQFIVRGVGPVGEARWDASEQKGGHV